jgi:hypothetical protein
LSAEQRFWRKVQKTEGCWEWLACRNAFGYGVLKPPSFDKLMLAHRYTYELLVGPIPDGLQLDHLCRNRGCVNPAHLEPVTNRENCQRGQAGAFYRNKTHCPQGHPYDETNTYRTSVGGRMCKACITRRSKERRAALKKAKK